MHAAHNFNLAVKLRLRNIFNNLLVIKINWIDAFNIKDPIWLILIRTNPNILLAKRLRFIEDKYIENLISLNFEL